MKIGLALILVIAITGYLIRKSSSSEPKQSDKISASDTSQLEESKPSYSQSPTSNRVIRNQSKPAAARPETMEEVPESESASMSDSSTTEASYSTEHFDQLVETKKCQNCNLRGADLSGMDLSFANLEGSDLTGANLQGSNLKDGLLKGANLSNVDLTDAVLVQVSLEKAIMVDANLQGINLTYGNLTGANLKGAKFEDARLIDTHLDGSDFSGADFTNTDLSGATLDGSVWTGAILEGATFQDNIKMNWKSLSKKQACSANISSPDFTPDCD